MNFRVSAKERRNSVKCNICPRNCSADRGSGVGFCGVGNEYVVARAAPHFWEEPCISGKRGSGAIFFCGCNLKCVFCQNYDSPYLFYPMTRPHGASRSGLLTLSAGRQVSEEQLMRIFDSLVEQGVNNINLVTPTHYAPMLAKTLEKYRSPVPIVYNSSGYESVETLKMLDGLVDIYLPDIKYFDPAPAKKYSGAEDYFNCASKAVLEMQRQVGTLTLGEDGVAKRGLIIRHLVMPGNVSQAIKVFTWVSENLPPDTYISLMRQYVPYGKAKEMPPIDRRLTSREYAIAKQRILALGFENCYFQGKDAAEEIFIPDFGLQGVDL